MTMDAPIYARNHTHTIRLFCMRACVYMLTPTLKTVSHAPRSSPCGGGAASLGLDSSRWEDALVSQVGLQSMEDAKLLLRLEQQQLLQHFAGVRTSARGKKFKLQVWQLKQNKAREHSNFPFIRGKARTSSNHYRKKEPTSCK